MTKHLSRPEVSLKDIHSYEQYVNDLPRAIKYYTQVLGYKEIGQSHPDADKYTGMKRIILAGGPTIHLILSTPTEAWSVAGLYLKKHPEGIGFVNFRVYDFESTIRNLQKREATFLFEPTNSKEFPTSGPELSKMQAAIATPISDVGFRFLDTGAFGGFGPHFIMTQPMGSYESPMGYECIDHMTVNMKSLQPLTAFYKDVMGFEEFWGIDFHTNDVNPDLPVGSGLKSKVWWHKDSGIKFANNEPAPPYFRNSQIDIYLSDNGGSGIQHVALRVENILATMEKLGKSGGLFMEAPRSYYDKIPARLKHVGFDGTINEPMSELQKRSILVDASTEGYLLQIFSHELGRQHGDAKAGPLFYEIIQREGDNGFGGGNFRALFESIEQDQIATAKTAPKLPLELL